MTDANWLAQIDGAEAGPYTPAEFKALAEQGHVGPETPVKRTGMKGFVPAKQIKGLLPLTTATTPASPTPFGNHNAPRSSVPQVSPRVILPLIIGGSLLLVVLVLFAMSSGKYAMKSNSGGLTPTTVNNENTLSSIGLDIKTSYAVLQFLFPKSQSKEADYIELGLTENRSIRWKHQLDIVWNDDEKKHFEHVAGAQVLVVEGLIPNLKNNYIGFCRRSMIPSTNQLFTLTAMIDPVTLDCKISVMNDGELPESTDIGKVEMIPFRGSSSISDWISNKGSSSDRKESISSQMKIDQLNREHDEKEKRTDTQNGMPKATINQDSISTKVTTLLKIAHDSHEAGVRARSKYMAAIDQFEKSTLLNASSYAYAVQLWLTSAAKTTEHTNYWTGVQNKQKEFNGPQMDNSKADFTSRLKSLQDAIAKMTTDDAASVAIGNKSVVEDADKADPTDAPVFEFVLPIAGDSNPVIFRNRGKDVRLSDLKKK